MPPRDKSKPTKKEKDSGLKRLKNIDNHLGKNGLINKQLAKQTTVLGKMETKLGKLGCIDSTLNKIEKHTGKLNGIDAKLGKLNSMETKLGKLGSIDTKLNQLGEHTEILGSIDSNMETHATKLDAQTEKLGSIDDSLDAHTAELNTQTGTLGSIDGKLGELNAMMEPLAKLGLNDRGEAVSTLHSSLIALGYAIPQQERDDQVLGVGTRGALMKFQQDHGLRITGTYDEATQIALAKALMLLNTGKYHIEGRLFFSNGRPDRSRFNYATASLTT
jgi:archaellum component FlaC